MRTKKIAARELNEAIHPLKRKTIAEGKWFERGMQGGGIMTTSMLLGSLAASAVLGLLTIFVWDVRTALILAGDGLVWGALHFGLFLIGNWRGRR